MSWARLDDQANGSAKLLALSDTAFRLWTCALIYCQANLTDGHVPEFAVKTFAVRGKVGPAIAELTRSLVPGKQCLWHVVDDGYQLHDFLDWNDSREKILAEREKASKRKERWKQQQNADEHALENAFQDGVQFGVLGGVPERVPNASSTTTITERSSSSESSRAGEQRALPPAPDAGRSRLSKMARMPHGIFEVRHHILAAVHRMRNGDDPQYHDSDPLWRTNLDDEIKRVATALNAVWKPSQLESIIAAALGREAVQREAYELQKSLDRRERKAMRGRYR